ncbi:unnamed protein product [Nesidiocoris tenuis]|uniref:EF-hand domain-containing protein n=1 Tax=Nesidiocoris tenuis TaxID=355587 RepID=A0A6H5HDG9_9HEMI|nr:unnamed protein product [Nesidiocoris tenuis]
MSNYYRFFTAPLDCEKRKQLTPVQGLATANEETLPVRLREDARSLFLQHQGQLLLNSEELKNMCLILDKKTSLLNGEEQQYLNYLELSQVMATSSQKCNELIPNLPQLDGLEKSFHSFYVCTAVRKFLFFLDPLHTGKIKVQDILTSSFLDDLLEAIREQMLVTGQEPISFEDVRDEVFDMIKPVDSAKITLQDLLNSPHPLEGENRVDDFDPTSLDDVALQFGFIERNLQRLLLKPPVIQCSHRRQSGTVVRTPWV